MSKKDYQLIAEVLRRALYQARNNPEVYEELWSVASDLAEAFKSKNDKFCKEIFYKLCDDVEKNKKYEVNPR